MNADDYLDEPIDEPGALREHFDPANPLVRVGEMSLERGRRIDYVMVRCGVHGPTLDVADCSLALDRPVDRVYASDHFGVVADLALPDKAAGSWAWPKPSPSRCPAP